jgi:hypothetical protein
MSRNFEQRIRNLEEHEVQIENNGVLLAAATYGISGMYDLHLGDFPDFPDLPDGKHDAFSIYNLRIDDQP